MSGVMTTTPGTSGTAGTPCGHPLAVAVGRLDAELDGVVDVAVWSLSQAETADTLVAITRLAARVAALELRVAAHAVAVVVADMNGATSTANWWAHQTRMTRAEAHRKVRLAGLLGAHAPVGEALGAGRVLVDQAGVVVDALEALPVDLEPGLVAAVEASLLDSAGAHDAKALRFLGQAILGLVAPEIGEAHDAAGLEREEREAAAAARFSMSSDGHGKVHGRFTVSSVQGAMLMKALLAYAAPRHQSATTATDATDASGVEAGVRRVWVPRPGPERLGHAFGELIEGLDPADLPRAGGTGACVVIRMDLAALLGGLKAASLDTGEPISAAQARLLACRASLIPMVLGTQSEVLDQGRGNRFFTRAQRIALGVRDGGCTAQGCDWPPGMCHAHHDITWFAGGGTDLKDGRLLCPRHHARVHDPAYEAAYLPGGKIAFTRRT